MGRGWTIVGTVIACLVKIRLDYGKPLRLPSTHITLSAIDSGFTSREEVGNESGDASPKEKYSYLSKR